MSVTLSYGGTTLGGLSRWRAARLVAAAAIYFAKRHVGFWLPRIETVRRLGTPWAGKPVRLGWLTVWVASGTTHGGHFYWGPLHMWKVLTPNGWQAGKRIEWERRPVMKLPKWSNA